MISKIALSLLMANYLFVMFAFLYEKNWGWFLYWLGVVISIAGLSLFGVKQL